MYAFAVYQAYASVNENNILFDIEQIRFLRVRDENLGQPNTLDNNTSQIIATFEHSPFVEMVIHDIEKLGVPKENIIALPLENLDSQTHIIDSIHRIDGGSYLDGAMMGGTILGILGVIYGFVLNCGPVIWGLLGLVVGFFLGLMVELLINKKKVKLFSSPKSEVIIQVTFNASIQNQLINLLKSRKAMGYLIMPQRLTSNS